MPGKAFIPRADTAKKVTIMLNLLKVTNCNGELMIPIKETKESIPIQRIHQVEASQVSNM